MKNYEYQIRDYKKFVQEKCINEKKEEQTIKICQSILTDQTLKKQSSRASYFEFLYEQSKFIKKRWWFLQGTVLLFLWIWLGRCTTDLKDTMRLLGIFATLFVILIVPEIWKNRRNGAIEIEQASYYTLLPDLCGKNSDVCSSRLCYCYDISCGSLQRNINCFE